MTWYELYEMARMECGLASADMRVTPQAGLIWLSEAQHQLQSLTNACKCTKDIILKTTTDGKYSLGQSIKSIDEATVTNTTPTPSNPTGGAFIPVEIVPLEHWHNLVNYWNQIPRLDQTKIYITHQNSTLYVQPFVLTGTLHLHYRPRLTPYSTGNTDDWGDYGTDPTAAMQENGPETAFDGALTGMRSYAKCMMLQAIPEVTRRLSGMYPMWWGEWTNSVGLVTKDSIDYVANRNSPYSIGGLI